MLNNQDIIKILDDAISDSLTSLGFEEKEKTEQELIQQTIEKISALFCSKLNQLENKA